MSNTLYDILEVSPNASLQIIRSAYRTLSQQYHPDKNSGVQTATLMAEINRAYMVLSDPLKRKEYDVSLTGTAKAATRHERPRREYRQWTDEDQSDDSPREQRKSQDAEPEWHKAQSQSSNYRNSEERTAEPPPDGQRAETPDHFAMPMRQTSTRMRWVFVLGSAAVTTAIISSFSQAIKTADVVADTKEVAIAG